MKIQFTKLMVTLLIITSSCSTDNSNQDTNDNVIYYALFKFLKEDGTSFQEGEIKFRDAWITIEGDTVYNDWLTLQVLPEDLHLDEHLIFGDLPIAYSYPGEYSEGDEWNRSTMHWFKYLDSDTIDFFRVRDSGKYNEYWHLDFFLNGEPIEPFLENYGDTYYFEITKEGL